MVKREICAVITKGIYWQIKDFLKIWLFTLPSNCYSLPCKVLRRIWHGSTSQLLPVPDLFENSHYLFAGLFTDIIGRSFILRSLVEVKSQSVPAPGTFKNNWHVMFTSAGTKTYSFVDGDCTESSAAYLLAISEKVKIKLQKEC